MREIKFRAWNQRRWLHSWEVAITAEGKVILYEPQDECWFFIDELPYEIQISEFTGLKDKNRVEIYEGDIVKWHNFYPQYNMQVRWASWICRFMMWAIPTIKGDWIENFTNVPFAELSEYYTKHYEVIGNIYENPELLGTK